MKYSSKENTIAVIVTYNPNIDSLVDNVNLLRTMFFQVIIVDNASKMTIPSIDEHVCIIRSDKNRGIAWGLNRGIKEAMKYRDCRFVISFDQDSTPPVNLLDYYNRIIENESNIGLIGTNFGTFNYTPSKISWEKKITIITSGCLHHIDLFKTVGLYDEGLFIDDVDFDYAIRVKIAGYTNYRIKEPLLKHQLGSPVTKYGLSSTNHNSIRRYYAARNLIIITKRYMRKEPFWISYKVFNFIRNLVVLTLIENNRISKLKAVCSGFWDGVLYKNGER